MHTITMTLSLDKLALVLVAVGEAFDSIPVAAPRDMAPSYTSPFA